MIEKSLFTIKAIIGTASSSLSKKKLQLKSREMYIYFTASFGTRYKMLNRQNMHLTFHSRTENRF